MLQWLDNIPLVMLIAFALLLGLAPFVPEPHIIEKLRMLKNGTLNRPLDIFDLFYHALPFFILLLKLIRMFGTR